MSIHDTTYLHRIWIYLNEKQTDIHELNEKVLNYFLKEIHLMLNGSFSRPFIDEEWFYQLLYLSIHQENNLKYFYEIYHLMKEINSKLKDKSQPSYIPFLGRIIQRLIKENNKEILSKITNEFIYHLFVSLILGNNSNTNDINLNYLIEIDSLINLPLKLKEISHLIQCCLMTENSETCLKFIQYLLNIRISNEEGHSQSLIDYIQQFLSIIIRTTVYDLDEINRRIKMKRDLLVKNGETIFDLRAKLFLRKSNEQENENSLSSVRQIFFDAFFLKVFSLD